MTWSNLKQTRGVHSADCPIPGGWESELMTGPHLVSQTDLLDKVPNVLTICELGAKGNGLTGFFQLSFGLRNSLHCFYT